MMGKASHPAALYQLRKITRVLAVIILVIIVFGFFLPSDYRIERSILIKAPQNEIQQKMFRGDYLPYWMFIQDGQINAFVGTLDVSDSAILSYDKVTDTGLLSLVELSHQSVFFNVRPKKQLKQINNQISFQTKDNGTRVTWVIEGNLSVGLLGPYLAVFANHIAGNNFEKSLNALKKLIENQE